MTAFDDLEGMQNLIAQKLDEIGIQLTSPVSFAKYGDMNMISISGVWHNTDSVEEGAGIEDEFFSIIEGAKQAEAIEKKEREEQARLDAIAEMERLRIELSDDD